MTLKIAVVIPCYKVKAQIKNVLSGIGPEVSSIILVDDKCPEGTGSYAQEICTDKRLQIIFHETNQGVGGAVISGYKRALELSADIVVKLDGDGQMDPALIMDLVHEIEIGNADYTKGNRFFSIEMLSGMPVMRIVGNTVMSFLGKTASGYWNIMDPANGFTAIHCTALRMLQLEKISKRYFFETDMLFRLNTFRAVVKEMPMEAAYGDEKSNLNLTKTALEFPFLCLQRFAKRIFYNYFLRDFNICSLELIVSLLLIFGGTAFGTYQWHLSNTTHLPATTGTVMLAALPIIIGFQLFLSAVSFDVMNVPTSPIHRLMPKRPVPSKDINNPTQ